MKSGDLSKIFDLDPNRSTYISSWGPKGTGKSELNTRFFVAYPYNGFLMDTTGDVDPNNQFTIPLTRALHMLAHELSESEETNAAAFDEFRSRLIPEWYQQGKVRFPKYRLEPSFLSKDWLEDSDAYVGLSYLVGDCFQFLDEINELAPANRTPRWTRQSLRMGRHRNLTMGMTGPRPSGLDPNVLNQSDLVTIHGQLHEIDIRRMAQQLHSSDKEFLEAIAEIHPEERDGIEVSNFLVYNKRTKDLVLVPPLPPRKRKK